MNIYLQTLSNILAGNALKLEVFSLCVQSLWTGELSGTATQFIEDDERIKDVLLHKQQPHVKLFKPHHVCSV